MKNFFPLLLPFYFRPHSPYLCAPRCANLICTRTHAFAFPIVVTPDLTWHGIIYDSHVTFTVSTAFCSTPLLLAFTEFYLSTHFTQAAFLQLLSRCSSADYLKFLFFFLSQRRFVSFFAVILYFSWLYFYAACSPLLR